MHSYNLLISDLANLSKTCGEESLTLLGHIKSGMCTRTIWIYNTTNYGHAIGKPTNSTILQICTLISGDGSALPGQAEKLSDFVRRMVALGEELLPKVEDVKAEKMGDMIDQEMEETQQAIEAASKRIAVRL